MSKTPLKLAEVAVDLKYIKGKLTPDSEQHKATREMYVELATRISIQSLHPDEGLLREALTSLHEIFAETRRILNAHGPDVAIPFGESDLSFGEIAVAVLNQHLRPFLSKWHPFLQAHEAPRSPTTPPLAHEAIWPEAAKLRQKLEELRGPLMKYADLLAEACGISRSLTLPAAGGGLQRHG